MIFLCGIKTTWLMKLLKQDVMKLCKIKTEKCSISIIIWHIFSYEYSKNNNNGNTFKSLIFLVMPNNCITDTYYSWYHKLVSRICINNKQHSCIIKTALSITNPFLELNTSPKSISQRSYKGFCQPHRMKEI